MAQRRMLNKTISLSAQVNKLALKQKLIYTWSIPHLDDYGLISNDPGVIKAMVVPMIKDITISDIKEYIAKTEEVGLTKEFSDCIEFLGFQNHQSISPDKRAKCHFQKIPRNPQENLGENKNPQKSPVEDKIREDKRREEKIRELAAQNAAGRKDQDIIDILNSFKCVNSSYRKYFGNKSQRAAADRLEKMHGKDNVLQVVALLEMTNKQKFAPKVYTACQLEDNWDRLKDFCITGIKPKKTLIV